jgi:hypothetical protein
MFLISEMFLRKLPTFHAQDKSRKIENKHGHLLYYNHIEKTNLQTGWRLVKNGIIVDCN